MLTTPPPPPPPPPPTGGGPPSGFPPGGYPTGGYPGAPITHPKGTQILILGIVALACCSILGPVAWVMGNNAIKEIDASGMPYANRGTVNAGRICGIIATVFLALSIVWLVLGGAASVTGGS